MRPLALQTGIRLNAHHASDIVAIRLNALDIVRCRFPQASTHGDPSKPAPYHRVLVIRTLNEADGSQWAHVVFGTGQGTADKGGEACSGDQIDVDANPSTGLTEQTRFHFKKHVALKVEEPWFPADTQALARGRLPKALEADVFKMIETHLPPGKLSASTHVATPPKVAPIVTVKPKRLSLPGAQQGASGAQNKD